MGAADIAALILLSVLWGGSFFFIEVLVAYLPPLTIVTIRVGLAAIILWIIVLSRGLALPATGKQWLSLCVLGFLNNALPFCLIVWGQTQINSGLASIFNATTPFFTVIIAGVFLADEKITGGKILGVFIGMIGVVVLIGPEALSGLSGSTFGQLAVMSAALSYALAAVYARRFKVWGISPMIIVTGQVTSAALMLLPFALIIDTPWTLSVPPLHVVLSMLGLAVFCTALAYIIYFRLIASAGATNAALVTFLVPVSAILLGVFILHERFTPIQAAGMALILAGLIVMDGRFFRRRVP